MGKWKFWTPVKLKPWTDWHTICQDWLCPREERNVCSKFGKNRFTGDFWAEGWNKTFCVTFIYFFFSDQRREETPGRILTRNMAQKTRNRARMCLFGIIKWKIEIWPLFTPKNLKLWPWIGNFQPKWWNMKLQVYQKVLNQSRWKFNTMLGT